MEDKRNGPFAFISFGGAIVSPGILLCSNLFRNSNEPPQRKRQDFFGTLIYFTI